jgi:hypothetical protein
MDAASGAFDRGAGAGPLSRFHRLPPHPLIQGSDRMEAGGVWMGVGLWGFFLFVLVGIITGEVRASLKTPRRGRREVGR